MIRWLAPVIFAGVIALQVDARRAARLDALRLQVSLDRAGFSVGEIDGRFGAKTLKALQAFQLARGLSVSNAPDDATWTAFDRTLDPAPLPPTIAYIVTAEDARLAVEAGVDGIVVSNHGGRQLDGAAAPLRALPAVVAQAGAMTVMSSTSGFSMRSRNWRA